MRPEDDRGPIKASKSRDLLQTLHIMNADGSISADMRRKFKQVNHLVELFRPTLEEIAARREEIVIVDASCGSSYVGILLAHYVQVELGHRVRVHGVDADPGRVTSSRQRAESLGLTSMTFATGSVREAPFPEPADLLVSLHGCDTATDEALLRGVSAGIPYLQVVPCCQKEIRPLLRTDGRFAAFLEHGIVANELAAAFTDVLRALWLRTRGYRTEIVELVPLEHTMKNRLIRGKRTGRRDAPARQELEELLQELVREPLLIREGRAPLKTGSPA